MDTAPETFNMRESEVIEVDGVFVGAAIASSERGERYFFAVDTRLKSMHGKVQPSLADVKLQAQRQFRRCAISPR